MHALMHCQPVTVFRVGGQASQMTTNNGADWHAGLCVRVVITYFIMGKARYTWKERVFYAIAWTPKATVQASLSAVPLALISSNLAGSPDYAQWQQWGKDCLATGIFAIIVCATLGTFLVFWLAPVLLEKEVCSNVLATDIGAQKSVPAQERLRLLQLVG